METVTKSAIEMTASELEQLLAEKKKSERLEKAKKERKYIQYRDTFVKTAIAEMADISAQMRELKARLIKVGNETHDLMYEIFDKEAKDMKSFTLVTEDQDFKLEIQRAEIQQLNETAEVAINEIKDLLREKFANRNKTMYGMFETVLMKNNKGDYDPRLVAKLRKFEADVNDDRFSKALDTLSDAYYVAETSMYVRGYARTKEGKYEVIPMQFSAI